MKRGIPGAHRFEVALEALLAVRNAMKQSWMQKDSDISKKRGNAILNKRIQECHDWRGEYGLLLCRLLFSIPAGG